jgi:hypothetical protein
MSDSTHDLLVRGSAAARVGEAKEAKFHLEWMLNLDPTDEEREEAWYWLAMVSKDPVEKRKYLEDILASQPHHLLARREWMILNGELKEDEIVDPNNLPAPEIVNGAAPQLDRFTCPQCGGRMVYSPDGSALVCEFCESKRVQKKATPGSDQDFLLSMATIKGHSLPQGQTAYICQGCGAGFILASSSLTINCPFCHTPYALGQAQTRQQAAPTAIIPARVSAQSVTAIFDRWRGENHIPLPDKPIQIQGIYLPVWWFVLGGEVHYRYSVHEEKKAPAISYANSRPVLRANVVVPASNHFLPQIQRMINRIDFAEMTDFKTDYLADWPAETYQISVGDASLKARQIGFAMEKKETESIIPSYAEGITYSSHALVVESYQLVLVPAWVGSVSLSEKETPLFIDAISGEVQLDQASPARSLSFWQRLFG